MNITDIKELAELCWPDNKWIRLDETWRENIGVPVGTTFDPDPVVLDEEAFERFDPSTDWNDAHRVVDVLVERRLFHQWQDALNDKTSTNTHPLYTVGAWATAALEVLRASAEEKN